MRNACVRIYDLLPIRLSGLLFSIRTIANGRRITDKRRLMH